MLKSYTLFKLLIMEKFKREDFEGAGQYIIRKNKSYNWEKFTDGGRLSTFMYKVGYHHIVSNPKVNKYCLISMSDGYTFPVADNLDGLIDYLNNNPHNTKYRWVTRTEMLLLLDSQNGRRIKGTEDEWGSILFKPFSLWIGVHYSKNLKQWCINLLPCITIRIRKGI